MAKHGVPQINDVCRIPAGTEMKGSFISRSDIRIDGVFEGELVTSGKLVLGEKAVIRGNVMCSNADIWGKIEGDFVVGDTVNLKENSSFEGQMKTVRICIEMGATFSGGCQIINEAEFKSYSAEFLH